MKRRIGSLILMLSALLSLCATARADVLWSPRNDHFFEQHYDQCEYIGRQFYANGDEGFITLWDAPGGTRVVHQFPNGYTLWVYYQYEDWVCAVVWGDEGEISGWASIEDFALRYDYLCFAEEYGDQIYPYDGQFAGYDGNAAEIVFYEYPGAPEPKAVWEAAEVLDQLTGTDSYIASTFTDEDGRTWGYVAYLFGSRNLWFCLDEPEGRDFPARQVGTPELTEAREPTLPARGYVPYILSGVLVIAVVAAAAVLLARRKKRSA